MIVFDLLQDSEIRDAWNVSDAQLQQLMNAQKSPKLQELMMELHTIQTPDDPFFDNSDAETQGKFLDLLERMQLLYMEDVAYLIDNTLTGEQKQKVGEALLASMGEIPLVSPNMFEALTLTDDQRQQMERIKEALEPEFEKNLETFTNASRIMSNKFLEELERQGIENPQDFEEKMRAIAKKLRAEDAEFNKIFEESLSLGRAFATQLKVEMYRLHLRLLFVLCSPTGNSRNGAQRNDGLSDTILPCKPSPSNKPTRSALYLGDIFPTSLYF